MSRHRGRARPDPPPVRSAHRPVPGGQAPAGRPPGGGGAVGGGHLGRRLRPRGRTNGPTGGDGVRGPAGHPAGRDPGRGRLRGGGQGGDPGPRRHGVHLGARRPHPPPSGHDPPPAHRRHRPAPGRGGPTGPRGRAAAADRRAAPRGRAAAGAAGTDRGLDRRRWPTRPSSAGPWPTRACWRRTGRPRSAGTPERWSSWSSTSSAPRPGCDGPIWPWPPGPSRPSWPTGPREQTERFVGPTLRGDIVWCQLFSEPGAGSDLAALTTRATRVDGGWSLEGQKVWTSVATRAHMGICLARTDPDGPKHRGITYFLVDMASPGIEVRPLREITGEALFNEVFFDGCFVPDDCVVGEVGRRMEAGPHHPGQRAGLAVHGHRVRRRPRGGAGPGDRRPDPPGSGDPGPLGPTPGRGPVPGPAGDAGHPPIGGGPAARRRVERAASSWGPSSSSGSTSSAWIWPDRRGGHRRRTPPCRPTACSTASASPSPAGPARSSAT